MSVSKTVTKKRRSPIAKNLPEKVPIEVMADYVDVLLVKSLKIIGIMIENGTADNKELLAAANSTVNIGKFIHQRRMDMARKDTGIVIDEELKIGGY